MIVRARTQLGHSAPVESLTPSTLQTEGSHVTGRNYRWIPLIALPFAATLAACGGTSTPAGTSAPATSAPATSAPVATATASTASTQCPSGATVGSALGITLPNATGVSGGGQLPGGATGIVCNYHAAVYNVLIEVLNNAGASFIPGFTSHFLGTVKSVSGVGDSATSFYEPLGAGHDNEGVVAAKGTTLVDVTATYTPATLSQIEALVNSLL
jgi:hypothetical protein